MMNFIGQGLEQLEARLSRRAAARASTMAGQCGSAYRLSRRMT